MDIVSEAARLMRLPKWAQDELRHLQQEVASLKGILSEVHDPDACIEVQYGLDYKRSLPNLSWVRFNLGKNKYDQMEHIDVRLGDKGQSIYVNGGNSIAVCPGASNTVDIRIRER